MEDPRVLVDSATRDDAAVFRLADDRAVVVTVDFFSPIVDDPYAFGAIAAANALSDLYAMGATPRFALNLVAWPRDPDIFALLADTLRGGHDVVSRAGAFVLGGHSIDDNEPKYGMVAIGDVHPDRIHRNTNGQVGDALVLTKPLGTGVLATALKNDRITADQMAEAVDAMCRLNAGAAEAIAELHESVHAVTDVTGFGLLGHLHNLVSASGVGANVETARLPVFELVRDLIAEGAVPGGTKRNVEWVAGFCDWDDVPEGERILACDAQTSGGLLIAVAPEAVDQLTDELRRRGAPAHAVIGELTPHRDRLITLR